MRHIFRVALLFLIVFSTFADAPITRPQIYGISFVRLKATDFEKSRAFYEKILGLRGGFDDC